MNPTTHPHHSVHRRRRLRAAAALVALGTAGAGVLLNVGAGAHGYVNGAVKARAATTANANRGAVQWEPQSVEGPKGFPGGGPADGHIASGGQDRFSALDAQSETKWFHWPINTGPLKIDWTYTAPHSTAKWDYFMTKQGWDPNAPLARSAFEQIGTVKHNFSSANTNPSHTITVPANRSGYHVILAVWEVGDTANSFYNVIDVHVGSGTSPTTATPTTASPSDPTTVPGPTTTHVHPTTVPTTAVPTTAAPTTAAPTTTAPTTTAAPTTRPAPTTTRPAPTTAAPTTAPPAPAGGTWSPRGTYRTGDVVTWQGRTYRCRQPHRGWGDVNWISALALWTPIG